MHPLVSQWYGLFLHLIPNSILVLEECIYDKLYHPSAGRRSRPAYESLDCFKTLVFDSTVLAPALPAELSPFEHSLLASVTAGWGKTIYPRVEHSLFNVYVCMCC